VEGKGVKQRGMKEAPENGKESSHSAHAYGMNEWILSSSPPLGIISHGRFSKLTSKVPSSFFWDVTLRHWCFSSRRFDTTYWPQLQ